MTAAVNNENNVPLEPENEFSEEMWREQRREGVKTFLRTMFYYAVICLGIGWLSFAGQLVGYALWVVPLSLVIAPVLGWLFVRKTTTFVAYAIPRLVVGIIIAAIVAVAWILILALTLPGFLWVWLVGDLFAGASGFGGTGAIIVIACAFAFTLSWHQLLKPLHEPRPMLKMLWLVLWTALLIVTLLPAMGASVLYGQM